MTPVRALVLDDSAICRARLKDILEHDGQIRVVGEAPNGDAVLDMIARTRPNILLVDLQMPGTGGQATIEHVMANRPLPILVVTGQPEGVRRAAVFESIRRGALDLAEKPAAIDQVAAARLRQIVVQLASVPVVRHVAGKRAPAPPARPLAQTWPAVLTPAPAVRVVAPNAAPAHTVIGIGASAGGPLPLVAILSELPADFPAAIAVVQHLPKGFARSFVEFLQARISLQVVGVSGPTPIRSGCVYLSVEDQHLVAKDARQFGLSSVAPVEGHRPAADVLLRSLAQSHGSRAVGVILSGIGADGVAGLGAMHARGALTLAQHETSCAVYGMPRAAIAAGFVDHAVDPLAIARTLRERVQSSALLEGRAP